MNDPVYVIGYGKPGMPTQTVIAAKEERAKKLAVVGWECSIYEVMRCDASQAEIVAAIMKRTCDTIPHAARNQSMYKSPQHSAYIRKELDLSAEKQFGDCSDLECRIQGLDPKDPKQPSTFLIYFSGDYTLDVYALRKSGNPKHRNFELKNVNKIVQQFNLRPERVLGGGDYILDPEMLTIKGPAVKYGGIPPQFALDVGKALVSHFGQLSQIKIDMRFNGDRKQVYRLWGILGYRASEIGKKVTAQLSPEGSVTNLLQEDVAV